MTITHLTSAVIEIVLAGMMPRTSLKTVVVSAPQPVTKFVPFEVFHS